MCFSTVLRLKKLTLNFSPFLVIEAKSITSNFLTVFDLLVHILLKLESSFCTPLAPLLKGFDHFGDNFDVDQG